MPRPLWRRRLLQRGARATDGAARALTAAGHRLAERLAYRPREVVVVALLAAGLFGGLAIERWRARHPAIADRLEAEPARPTAPLPSSSGWRPRPRPMARCEEPRVPADRQAGTGETCAPLGLDLNRVTPAELARAVGISWRLAARIVAARDAVEGRAPRWVSPSAAGPPTVEPAAPPDRDAPDAEVPEAAPDTGSP